MATLVKDRKWYYSQFYDAQRKPNRKRVPLKTKNKRVAEKLHRKLEDLTALEQFDAWTGYDATKSDLPISKNSSLSEALSYYIDMKSSQDWRSKTAKDTSYVLQSFARGVGLERQIRSLESNEINSFLNRSDIAYATRISHKSKVAPFIKWCNKNKLTSISNDLIKIYNKDNEQEETVSYLTQVEIETLKETITEKVSSDMKGGYQSKERNALWLIDLIDWQR